MSRPRLPLPQRIPSAQRRVAPCVVLAVWSWATLGCERSQPDEVASLSRTQPPQGAWFTEITAEAGLDFRHDAGIDGSYFMPEIVGSGGALFDYDNDGDLDIYLVNGGPHKANVASSELAANRLFRQEADGTFTDVTDASGVGDRGYGMGCAVGDINNDGYADVYVTNFGPDALYRNNCDGTFSNITASAGIAGDRWSTSACFFDYDRDGFLDLFVNSYVRYDPPQACRDSSGRPDYCGPANFAGVPDVLYHNNGDGTFTDVTARAGIAHVAGKGLGVVAADFNADGWIDVYVANEGEQNQLWINLGDDGRFDDRAIILGTALNISGKAEASMGIAVGDVDGDADLDLFMTHLDRETNTLYLNSGDWFEDRTARAGLGSDSLPFTGFGTGFFDYDQDGDLDLLVVNGRVRRGLDSPVATTASTVLTSARELALFHRDYAEPNLLFENDGTGKFHNRSASAGVLCSRIAVSRGAMFGDVDRDGDLDVVLTNCNGPASLFRNDIPKKGHWITIRAFDPALNRDAIGAQVHVEAGGKTYTRSVTRAFSYLASSQPTAHFGVGDAHRVDRVTIAWPDGSKEQFPPMRADQWIQLNKGQGRR